MQQAPSKKDDKPVSHPADAMLGLPITLDREQSALDTLAEVSRRHLDYSSQRDAAFEQNVLLQDSDQALAEQALWAQLQQHNMEMSTQPGNEYDLQMPLQEPILDQPFTAADFAPAVQQTTQGELTTIDPQLNISQSFDGMDQLITDGVPQEQSQPVCRPFRWPAQPDDPQELDNSRALRTKQRGRFTDARRKQVQEIRKKGACIRCRMLKKPCSEGTPCNTCANVDTARLWKGKCLRTRLVDEFTAWSSGYFLAVSKLRTNPVISEFNRRVPGAVHIRLNFDQGPGMALNARIFANSGIQPLLIVDPSRTAAMALILEDSDGVADKLSAYCMSVDVLKHAVDAEPHAFIRTTLHQAIELVSQESQQQLASTLKLDTRAETRSCYSIISSLTHDTIELWMLTTCLTNSSRFVIRSTLSPDASIKQHDQEIIQAQLLAAIEVRASRLSKKVLNDMERRLLQRQQVSGFATFIAAVLLLNSVERMSALYQSLEVGDTVEWPVEAVPRSLWLQGPSFANLLTMILRMRGLPPRTYENEEGKLAVQFDAPGRLTKLNGSASEDQLRALDEQRRTALSAWLSACNISAAEVRSWLDDDPTYWHGKLIAGLLLPGE
ncbi:hypothetical protein AMS68_007455 [Peltaster fructicola]|uniref:Zn(2)-C6 fungal-type domain-containing protein n=1 Tax=Peltaster fructicola TaxID=286661 RepID=A0A6H0Y520_9PEZI|nr:hypothetical protein AMS68_007455 [Peltaster fructicola]